LAACGSLIQQTIIIGPVEADTGGTNQRARFQGPAGHGFYQQTSSEDAAIAEKSLAGIGPASISNRRTSEIDDGIGTVETMLPGSRLSTIPLDGRDG
jgi:predicted amino acid racemase